MRTFAVLTVCAVVFLGLAGGNALAIDEDELMPCQKLLIKASPKVGRPGATKFACKGLFALPSAASNPFLGNVQLIVRVIPPSGSGGTGSVILTCECVGKCLAPKGFKCGSNGMQVSIKPKLVKGALKLDVPLWEEGDTLPYAGDVAIRVISNGDRGFKNYCARFPLASAVRNDAKQFKAQNALAPAACSPGGAFLD